MINRTEAERLAAGIHAHRPDWPVSQLVTLAIELQDWALQDLAVALTWIAYDRNADNTPASRSPYRVKEDGPWHRIGTRAPERAPSYPKHHATPRSHPIRTRLADPDWYDHQPPPPAEIDPAILEHPDPAVVGAAIARAAIPAVNHAPVLPHVPPDVAAEAAAPLPPEPDNQADTDQTEWIQPPAQQQPAPWSEG